MRNIKKTIFLIAFPNSVHVENWISNIDKNKFKIIIYPSSFHKPSINLSKYIIPYDKIPMTLKIFSSIISIFNFSKFFFNTKIYIKQLKYNNSILSFTINKFKPHIVHCMEMQHAGYLYLDAKKIKHNINKVIVSNYGSDIFYYQKFQYHKKKIKSLLDDNNIYTCESNRDVRLAKKIKRNLKYFMIPNSCPITVKNKIDKRKFNSKKGIIIKGYQSKFGRAIYILNTLSSINYKLSNIRIYIFSCSYLTRLFIKIRSRNLNIKIIETLPKKELMKYFSKSRIYIGASISDGLSTSAIDAVNSFVFPIQSDSSTLNEILNEPKCIFNLNKKGDLKIKLINALDDKDIYSKVRKNHSIINKHYNKKYYLMIFKKLYD